MESKTERKVVIVGKYCVGKTALVDRFTENKFDEGSYQAVSVIIHMHDQPFQLFDRYLKEKPALRWVMVLISVFR